MALRITTMTNIPDSALPLVDGLYEALKDAASLLSQGRSFGFRVGLTQVAADVIRARHGEAAEVVVGNCLLIGDVCDSNGGELWRRRALLLTSALSRPVCWLQEHGYLVPGETALAQFNELSALEKLVWDKAFVGVGGEQVTLKNLEFIESLKPLEAYLVALPGYSRDEMGRQGQPTLDQHLYLTMVARDLPFYAGGVATNAVDSGVVQ